MKTGKLIINPAQPYQNRKHETFYNRVTFYKKTRRPGRKLRPEDKDSTRLQELSLLKNTYFGAIHYDIHRDMKLDNTKSQFFQELSLSEIETLYRLCELKLTQILQPLAMEVVKIPYAGCSLSGNRSNFINYEGNILWYYTCSKKSFTTIRFEDKRCYKRIPIFLKK